MHAVNQVEVKEHPSDLLKVSVHSEEDYNKTSFFEVDGNSSLIQSYSLNVWST
jgi:hypothetical protein